MSAGINSGYAIIYALNIRIFNLPDN